MNVFIMQLNNAFEVLDTFYRESIQLLLLFALYNTEASELFMTIFK